jgi:hypothetical protein
MAALPMRNKSSVWLVMSAVLLDQYSNNSYFVFVLHRVTVSENKLSATI